MVNTSRRLVIMQVEGRVLRIVMSMKGYGKYISRYLKLGLGICVCILCFVHQVRHGGAISVTSDGGTYQTTPVDHRSAAEAYASDQQRQTVLMWGSAMISSDRGDRENSPTNSNSSTPSMNGYDAKLIKHQQDTGNKNNW